MPATGGPMAFIGGFSGGVVTTQWVLTEVADALAGVSGRREVLGTFHLLDADAGTLIVDASPEWFDRGLSLYHSRPEKGWLLTDCLSFAVMADQGLTDALTGDRHFEQAGFRALLAS